MLFRRSTYEADASSDPFDVEALSYVDSLYASAIRLSRNPADAEDLVQETYLKAFRSRRRFKPGTNMKAWLFTILHNTFLNARRQAARQKVSVDSDAVEQAAEDLSGPVESPEQLLVRATLDRDLSDALDAMPDPFRQAVWLRDVEDFTYAEIATMLGVPPGTVMSRISRGRRLLAELLRQSGGRARLEAEPAGSRT